MFPRFIHFRQPNTVLDSFLPVFLNLLIPSARPDPTRPNFFDRVCFCRGYKFLISDFRNAAPDVTWALVMSCCWACTSSAGRWSRLRTKELGRLGLRRPMFWEFSSVRTRPTQSMIAWQNKRVLEESFYLLIKPRQSLGFYLVHSTKPLQLSPPIFPFSFPSIPQIHRKVILIYTCVFVHLGICISLNLTWFGFVQKWPQLS